MKNMVATALFIAITTCLFSQADKSQFLYTSDGKLIGEKQMLIKECADELDEEGMTKEGKEEICDCVLQQMASHLTYKDLNKMLKDDDFNFNKVFEDKKHKDLANGVIQCVFSFMHNGNELTSFRNEFLSECVKSFEEEKGSVLTSVDAQVYCSCMLDKIIENAAFTENFMSQISDENSPLLEEAALPCLMEAMRDNETDSTLAEEDSIITVIDPVTLEETVVHKTNEVKEKNEDIQGDILAVEIPLIPYLSTYMVKVKIGNVEKHFIIDSGASDVLINKNFEKELIHAGLLSKKDEVGDRIYSLADGRNVKAKVYLLNNLLVGGFTVNNVMAGVISDDASMLLGKSFLDKFSKWHIDNEKKTLYLEK